jgi:hypothetical protein
MQQADPFMWEAEPLVLAPGETGQLVLRLVIPPGMHVYRDQVFVDLVDAAGLDVGATDLPSGERVPDPATGSDFRELYAMTSIVYVPVTAPKKATGMYSPRLLVRHQGCRPGLCFPPQATPLSVLVRVVAPD